MSDRAPIPQEVDIDESEESRIYEWCVLFPYPMQQKEEQQLLKEIDEIFAEAGAKETARDKWGRRGLAYPVAGFKEGNFIVYYFDMDPAKVKEVDGQLRILKGVLRHLVVKPPKHYQIAHYAEIHERWLKERETVEQQRDREKEEKVQEQVARRAKMRAKATSERKKAEPSVPKQKFEEEAITEQIDKLISDDSLDL